MTTWSILSFQDSASPCMFQLILFYDFVVSIMLSIMLTVSILIAVLMFSSLYNHKFLHNHVLETSWTILPIIILMLIAGPSLQMLYLTDDPFSSSLNIKAVGHQWYWSYEYADIPDLTFDSYLTQESLMHPRLMDTTNSLVIPTNTKIRLITSSTDVIHAWTIPSMGVKADAVPGRMNQIMLFANRSGLFFGQCSELCGANHSFMPIKLEVVPLKNFLTYMQTIDL